MGCRDRMVQVPCRWEEVTLLHCKSFAHRLVHMGLAHPAGHPSIFAVVLYIVPSSLLSHPRATSRAIIRVKPAAKATGANVRMLSAGHLGHQFLHHHIQHGSRCKGQQPGQGGQDQFSGQDGEHRGQRLHDAGQHPSAKARRRDAPSARRGMDTMAPSGKFWMAMPSDKARAPAAEISAAPVRYPAYTTPTAIPSGMLWSVTASIIMVMRGSRAGGPSGRRAFRCRWGIR